MQNSNVDTLSEVLPLTHWVPLVMQLHQERYLPNVRLHRVL